VFIWFNYAAYWEDDKLVFEVSAKIYIFINVDPERTLTIFILSGEIPKKVAIVLTRLACFPELKKSL